MAANNAILVITERTNSGDAGTVGEGTLTLGTSDGLGSLISTSGKGTVALGAVETAGSIQTQGNGSLALGHATNGAIIATEVDGSVSFGRADGIPANNPSQITGNGLGALSRGSVTQGAIIGANGNGSTTSGTADGVGSAINTSSAGLGAESSGSVSGASNITTSASGAKSFGSAVGASSIAAQASGSVARGQAAAGGSIQSLGAGSSASGSVSSGTIVASGLGSQAFGNSVVAGSQVLASGSGALAFGQAENGFHVKASNISSLAFGQAENQSIEANGNGSFAGGFPLVGSVLANGVAAIAYGDGNTGNARLSTTVGVNNLNNSYNSLMLGQNGLNSSGTPGSWVSTDPLLVAGNGPNASTLANAYQLDKDGRVTTTASKVNTAIQMVTSSYTVNARTDRTVLCNTTSGIAVITLPAGQNGLEFFIADGKNSAGTNPIYIHAAGSDSFSDGTTIETIFTNAAARHIQYYNGVWYLLNKA